MRVAEDVYEFRRYIRERLREIENEPCRTKRERIVGRVYQYLILNRDILVSYPVFHNTAFDKLIHFHTVEKWEEASLYIDALAPR